jgi:hypothetical protein
MLVVFGREVPLHLYPCLDRPEDRNCQNLSLGKLAPGCLVHDGLVEQRGKPALVFFLGPHWRGGPSDEATLLGLLQPPEQSSIAWRRGVVGLIHHDVDTVLRVLDVLVHEVGVTLQHGRLHRREDNVVVIHFRPACVVGGDADELQMLLRIGHVPEHVEGLECLAQKAASVRQPEDAPMFSNVAFQKPMRGQHCLSTAGRDHDKSSLATVVEVVLRHPVPSSDLVLARSDRRPLVLELQLNIGLPFPLILLGHSSLALACI